jgi:uncharacterized protein (UPF0335 family)
MEFTIQRLSAEISQVEQDIATLTELSNCNIYEELKTDFTELIKKLKTKKRKLNKEFKKVYTDYLE